MYNRSIHPSAILSTVVIGWTCFTIILGGADSPKRVGSLEELALLTERHENNKCIFWHLMQELDKK